MALHKGPPRGQACMCTTSLEMASVRDGHYHLLCFWTQQRVVRFSFLLTLNVCFVPVSFTWSWLWHASWGNVRLQGGGGGGSKLPGNDFNYGHLVFIIWQVVPNFDKNFYFYCYCLELAARMMRYAPLQPSNREECPDYHRLIPALMIIDGRLVFIKECEPWTSSPQGWWANCRFTDVKQSIMCGACTEAAGIVFHIFTNASR